MRDTNKVSTLVVLLADGRLGGAAVKVGGPGDKAAPPSASERRARGGYQAQQLLHHQEVSVASSGCS